MAEDNRIYSDEAYERAQALYDLAEKESYDAHKERLMKHAELEQISKEMEIINQSIGDRL